MAKSFGLSVLVVDVWLLMGAMALCGALCYGELAARYPEAGGGYVYLREGFGRPIAFLYGWMALLVMDPGVTAALAVGLASYVGYLFKLSTMGQKGIAIASILFVAVVNIFGVKPGAWMIRLLTILKLGLLGLLIVWGFASANWSLVQLHSTRCPTTGDRIRYSVWLWPGHSGCLLFIRGLVGRNQVGRRSPRIRKERSREP